MKNNIKKRIMAGSMAVVMAAALAGTYSYHNGAIEVHAEEQTKELTEAAEKMLGDSSAETAGGFSKEESVYVKADASGKVSQTTVTEWLKNPANGDVDDVSDLNDIKNIKGEEEFTENGSNGLSWKSEGEDIYYQGTTDKELPVGVKVSYKLDGKSVSAEELAGKDGKVEIRFDYENYSKQITTINGKDVEMYTPFTMVTAMMLPTDEYKNVTIDNGKIISDADKAIVVGVAFPGLEENLDLDELDVDIPSSVTITADVKNASVGPTVTLASAEIMSEFNLDDVDSFDDLEDSINQLSDAANQLSEGSDAAADGAVQLADGSKTLADGVNTLNEKSGDLISGVNTLADGVGAYTGGVAELYDGSKTLTAGAGQLNAGAASLNDAIVKAAAGATQLKNGAEGVKGGMAAVAGQLGNAAKALDAISADNIAACVNVSAGEASVTKPDEEQIKGIINKYFADADETTKDQVKAAIEAALGKCEAKVGEPEKTVNQEMLKTLVGTAQTVQQGIGQAALTSDQLAQGVSAIADGAGSLEAALGKGDGTQQTIGSGAASLVAGSESLLKGTQSLEAGAEQLYNNSAPLMAGVTALKDGGSQLAGGVSQLANGANQLSDGANTLADGNKQLADGMSEFKTEGIDKLTEVFNGDIQNAIDRIDAMSALAKNYKSFAGIKDGMAGNTKFIIETEGVED